MTSLNRKCQITEQQNLIGNHLGMAMQPILNKIRLLTCSLLLAISSSASANETKVLNHLNELIKAKQYQQAYQYANEKIMDYGGEARFDYLMGLAALNIKAYEEAVFALERAVINRPKWEQARFQLAKAYYQVDNLAASKNELIKLKNDAKTDKFEGIIDSFIDQVDDAIVNKKRVFKQILAFSTGSDSNINSGTESSTIFLSQLGTTIPLAEGSRETEDTPFNLSYQAQYQEPLNQNAAIIAQLGLFRTDYADSPMFERTMADLTIKYQDVISDMTYQVGAFYRPMELDGSHYRDQYGFVTNWTLPIDANWSAGWQLGFGQVESQVSAGLDVKDAYASINAQYRTGRWQHTVSTNFTDVRADLATSKHRSHQFVKLDYQIGYVFSHNQHISLSTQWQKFNYDELDPTFLIVRDEEFWRAGLGWRYIQNSWLLWQVQLRHSEKTSNEPIFAYNRDEFIVGVTMQF